ncbi:MAG: AraC family transcriptional regulator [Ginsengibacter sp.]
MTKPFAKKNCFFSPFLDYFSSKLEATAFDNIIKIPPQIGTGCIKWHLLEEGFGFLFYNLTPKSDIEFDLFIKEESGAVYKVIYELEERLDTFSDKEAYLYSADFQKKIKITRGKQTGRLILIFNKEWLEKNHPNANEKIEQLLSTLIQNNQSTAIPGEPDRKSDYILRQLVEMMDCSSSTPLILKTKLFILLNAFLNKVISQSSKELPAREPMAYCSPHFKEIIEVAENLKKYINNPFSALPNIKNLAYEYNMSESTLRRHFKIVYGKNIYEYYQGKRMSWAKEEIENGDVTIGELALKLGFRKPNNFSKAFRKEFHILPNELKHILIMTMYVYFAN